MFHFLGAKIWVPMLVYRYKNPSGYVAGWIMLILMKYILGNGKGFSHALNFFVTSKGILQD